jgi:hypothetical protein
MRLLIYPSGRKGGHAPKTVQFRFLPMVQKYGSARSFDQRCHCLWLEVTDRSYCRIDRCTGIILLSLDWVLGRAVVCMGFYILMFYTRRRICLMHFWCVLTRINTIGRWLSLTRFWTNISNPFWETSFRPRCHCIRLCNAFLVTKRIYI